MILHIVPDSIFINMAYQMFEKVDPNNHKFIMINNEEEIKYLKEIPIIKISLDEFLSDTFIKNLSKYECVILHFLDSAKIKLVLNSSQEINFCWIGWGADYYNYINKNLLLPKTKLLKSQYENKSLLESIKNKIKVFFIKEESKINRLFNKINYFAPVLANEYDLMPKNFKPKYLEWNYGTLEIFTQGLNKSLINGINILLGNNGTYENNHLEIFEILKKINFKNQKIICPLSYGDSNYINIIRKEGKKVKNFQPLLEFMDLQTYNKVLLSCSIVIMNHIRQQALGNIHTMMYLGAKIFLNKQNPIYQHLKELGAVIFCMEELNTKTIQINLSKSEIEINKRVVYKYLNEKEMIKKTQIMLNIIKGNKSYDYI